MTHENQLTKMSGEELLLLNSNMLYLLRTSVDIEKVNKANNDFSLIQAELLHRLENPIERMNCGSCKWAIFDDLDLEKHFEPLCDNEKSSRYLDAIDETIDCEEHKEKEK